MKQSHICPKCDSVEVVKIEGTRYNQAKMIPLTGLSNARLDRFICTTCGYTEEWVQIDKKFEKWVDKALKKGEVRSDFV